MTYEDWLEKWENILSQWNVSIGHTEKRPWGGFITIHDKNAAFIADWLFTGEKLEEHNPPIVAKLLFVLPGERLSWQYHKKRMEMWRVVENKVGFKISDTTHEPSIPWELGEGSKITIGNKQCHRLIGLKTYSTVGEIWINMDYDDLSDENDIVRLNDKYIR